DAPFRKTVRLRKLVRKTVRLRKLDTPYGLLAVPGRSCELTSSSFRTIQTGDHPSARLEVEVVLEAALRASSTTVSRTLMYSRNRRRPSSVIRQRVWGRFLWNPFQISTKPASLRTWR